jgi:hypothetical protein
LPIPPAPIARYIAHMKIKNADQPHDLVTEADLNDDDVDAWEEKNWAEIEAALAQAEASFKRGDYAEFDIEKFLIEGQNRASPKR